LADGPPAPVLVVLAVVPGGAAESLPAVAGAAGPVTPAEFGCLVPDRPAAALPRRRVGPLTIDPAARRVTLAGRPLVLTRREYDLLAHLAAAPGRVFTKQELLHAIWSAPTGVPTRRLDAQVARLRRRLGDHRALLVTVWGVGYRLAALDSP
jgi:DNA-binding response OmpR family regulator